MIYVLPLLLIILFTILIHPLLISLYFIIKGFWVSLICIDIMYHDCEFGYNYKIIINFFKNKKYKILIKFLLKNKQDEVFNFFNKNNSIQCPLNLYDSLLAAMHNIIVTLPVILPKMENLIIESGKKDPIFVYDFAVKTKEIGFSKKKLFVAISHDIKIRDKFILAFSKDKEIEKLTSLL